MGILNGIVNSLLTINEQMKEPEFKKVVDNDNNEQLNALNTLLEKVGDNDKNKVIDEILKVKSGILGEKNVEFELKQIHDIPFYCMHDIRLVFNDEVAQLDFVLVMRNCVLILESKRMYGNISVDNEGNFIRQYQDYKHNIYKKEGMYSPITQNKRHVDIVSRMLKNEGFENVNFRQLVVIANDKTVVDKKFAPKNIKELICKYDQLEKKVKEISEENLAHLPDKKMKEIATFFLVNDTPIVINYADKLGVKVCEPKVEITQDDETIEVVNDELYEALKSYRYNKAKEKNLLKTIWYIFTNEQLSELIINRPSNKNEFIAIKGFGETKYKEYGEEIIEIIKKYSNKEEVKVNEDLFNELKKYRYTKAKELNMLDKQGFILSNLQIGELSSLKYDTLEKLKDINGFNDKKISSYGKDVLEIVLKYKK